MGVRSEHRSPSAISRPLPTKGDALALRADTDEQPLMVASQPDVYYLIPHYAEHGIVLVRHDAVSDLDESRERITDSWVTCGAARPRT
jgi:hypothetical protein